MKKDSPRSIGLWIAACLLLMAAFSARAQNPPGVTDKTIVRLVLCSRGAIAFAWGRNSEWRQCLLQLS